MSFLPLKRQNVLKITHFHGYQCILSGLFTLMLLFSASCSPYLRSIPTFPESRIVDVQFPLTVIVGDTTSWTVYANKASDSLEVLTFAKNWSNPIFRQYGKFVHDNSPISGLTANWLSYSRGDFVLSFKVFNKWTSHTVNKFITVRMQGEYF